MATLHPRMKWCEREDKVYLTIELPDAKDAAVTIEAREFTFRATAAGATYEERIALFADVSKEKSTYAVTARQVFCVLIKEEAKWWERLLREGEKKPANLHVDFDRWADEDDDAGDVDTSGFDMQSMMGGGGGMGGGGMPGGMDFSQLMAGMGGGGAGGGAGEPGGGAGEPDMAKLQELIASMKAEETTKAGSALESVEEGDEEDLPELV